MLEKAIETKLRSLVKVLGGQALKLTCPGVIGVPDRLVLLPRGQIYFIELKQPGRKPTAAQQYWIDKLNRWGFDARVIDSPEGVEAFAKELMLK